MPFIVMRLMKSIKTNVLLEVNVCDGDHLGFLSVYKTKKAAMKVWGKDVQLAEVEPLGTTEGREASK